MESPPALAESLIFTIGVRYILALAPSAKSTVSGCTDNCQSVMAFGNAVLGFLFLFYLSFSFLLL